MTRFPIDGTGRLASEREHPTAVLPASVVSDSRLVGLSGGQVIASQVGSAFPLSGVLDNFTRANENPLSSGGNWGQLNGGFGYSAALKLASNTAQMASLGAAASYWKSSFSGNCEVYATVGTLGDTGEVDFWLRVSGPTTGAGSGYLVSFNQGIWRFYRVDSGVQTAQLAGGYVSFGAGDSIGVRMIGSALEVWQKASGGSWRHIGGAADATYAAGFVGVGLDDSTTSTTLTSFGGGSVTAVTSSGWGPIVQSAANANDPAGLGGYGLYVVSGADGLNQGCILVSGRQAAGEWSPRSWLYSDMGPGWFECKVPPVYANNHTLAFGFSVYRGGVNEADEELIINIMPDGFISFSGVGGGSVPDVMIGRVSAGMIGVVGGSGGNGTGTTGAFQANQVQQAIAAPTYGTTVTPDLAKGAWQAITATNSTAFTIAAPANPPDSTHTAELTIEVLNSSGGAMGAITWNAAFVFPTGAWANPANTKKRFARFEWNGTKWICTSVATADY